MDTIFGLAFSESFQQIKDLLACAASFKSRTDIRSDIHREAQIIVSQ
jgi:hypothetical protein